MSGEQFTKLWEGNEGRKLRQYVINQAKRRSRRPELQEEYVQEAWLAIGTAPNDADIDFLKELAYKAIYSSYWQEHKEHMMMCDTRDYILRTAANPDTGEIMPYGRKLPRTAATRTPRHPALKFYIKKKPPA